MKRFRKLHLSELERLDVEQFKSTKKNPITVVLDNVRSMHNVGTVFRTADAFLIEKIILCGITAQPPHREIQKTALGATDSVDWEYWQEPGTAIRELKQQGYQVIAIEQTEHSTPIHRFQRNGQPVALILGHEVEGVQQSLLDLCDAVLEIPQWGTKHSLNISVAAGITLYMLTQGLPVITDLGRASGQLRDPEVDES